MQVTEKRLNLPSISESGVIDLVIRAASLADIPSIVNVNASSATKEEIQGFSAPEWVTYSSAEELRKAWDRGNTLKDGMKIIVAEKGGRVVGFIVYKMESDHVYIDDLDIFRSEQRKGIGRVLVGHVEDIARVNGRLLMKTDTTESAEGIPWKSYDFWIKMGYKDTGERLPTKWSFKTIPFVKILE